MTSPALIPSFIKGNWWTPSNPQKLSEIQDTSTEEVIFTASTEGIDTAGAIEYARAVGQKNLGELTIHERALKLKELAIYLNEHKQELYDISFASGSTQRDHYIDIDGGIGTLFTLSLIHI